MKPFRSLATPAKVATFFLALEAGIAMMALVLDLYVDSGGMDALADQGLATILSTLGAIVGFAVVGFFGSMISFLVWLNRAAWNLRALGVPGLQYTPGWAVGWWFVPFANFVKPYHVVKEIVLASEKDAVVGGEYETDWMTRAVPSVVSVWWMLWVAYEIIQRIETRMATANVTVSLLSSGFCIAAAATCIMVVRLVTARQEEWTTNVRLGQELGHAAERVVQD